MLTVNDPSKVDWENMPLHEVARGNAMDTYFTLKLFDLINEKIQNEENNLPILVDHVLSPGLSVFAKAEFRGINIDPKELDETGRLLKSHIINLEDDLHESVGLIPTDNVYSTKCLIEIFYTREGALELYPPARTGKGAPSTDADTIKLLLELIEEELERRG